jgi:hypothetical protein
LYLSIGVFDKAAWRATRYQIRAARPVGTGAVTALSVPAEPGGFEEPFGVDYYAGGLDWQSCIKFAPHGAQPPSGAAALVWASHPIWASWAGWSGAILAPVETGRQHLGGDLGGKWRSTSGCCGTRIW